MTNKKAEEKMERSFDEFKEVLRIYKSLFNSGAIHLMFSPRFALRVDIDEDSMEKELASAKIESEILKDCGTEIFRYLGKLLSDKERKFLKGVPEDKKEDVEKKCMLVEKEIITEEMIEDFLFQTMCKNYI